MYKTPIQEIKRSISEKLPSDLIDKIPEKWEKIGDVLIIVLPKVLDKYKLVIAEKYAEVLNCSTVLNDVGGITGELREPQVDFLFGDKDTVTIHKENGIKYKLDPQKIMFSSGNMDERVRMSKISNVSETIVDLFAGIGYFSLPLAVYSSPKKIYACEKNKLSYNFLCENIALNNVLDLIQPVEGDNRIVAPKKVADRVIMGYIGDTFKFIPTALECLNNFRGIIHFHEKFPDNSVPDKPLRQIQNIADIYNRSANIINLKKIKSYAPGISHFVFDVKIENI
jgi:tRNA wybutosine-synthesizing protein 2